MDIRDAFDINEYLFVGRKKVNFFSIINLHVPVVFN